MTFSGKWLELEIIMLSEISQIQKDTYHISLIRRFQISVYIYVYIYILYIYVHI